MARPRTLFVCVLAVLLLAAGNAPAADAGAPTGMVQAINHARSWENIPGVRYSRRLSSRATAWAQHLLRNGYIAHSSATRGEVIESHSGARPRIRRTVGAWLRSPGHRRVILSRRYSRAGAGRAVGYMDGERVTIWVVMFAGG